MISARVLSGIRYGNRTIMFTCVQCGHRDSCERWFMTCPRCWVPMVGGTPETWWMRTREDD